MASLDQSGTSSTSTYTNIKGAAANTFLAQGFTVAQAGEIDSVKLNLRKTGTPSGNVQVTIYSDDGAGKPNTSLSDTATYTANSLTTSSALITFTFSTKPTSTIGTKYHIVITGSYAVDGTNYALVDTDAGAGYTGGTIYRSSDGSTWNDFSAEGDLGFEEYYNPPAATGYSNLLLMNVG